MADSKRFVPDATDVDSFGSPVLISAIRASLASAAPSVQCLAVALSGGADSAMLAVHAAKYARSRQVELHFLHVHHGLQAGADQWQAHVYDLAHRLNVPCHSLRVRVDQSGGDGMESAARTARYQALASLAAPLGVTHILLAHHQDDQAETVLLRLLRGAGPEGLGAMAPMRVRDGLVYLRPWLEVARSEILRLAGQFGELTGWHPVCDPTNSDDRYTRAAVRERLAPVLDDRWPGWQANLVRHAGLSREMALVLDEVASNDFKQLLVA